MGIRDEKPTGPHPELAMQFRAAADRLGLSERKMAAMANVSRMSVRLALAGENITITTLKELAPALQLRNVQLNGINIEIAGSGVEPVIVDTAVERLQESLAQAREAVEMLSRVSADAGKASKKPAGRQKR